MARRDGAFRRRRSFKGDHSLRVFCEALEDWTLLSTMDFINPAGGLWSVATNWVNGAKPSVQHVPNSSDNAVIDVPGNVTVTFQGSQPTVLTLQIDDTIWVNGLRPVRMPLGRSGKGLRMKAPS